MKSVYSAVRTGSLNKAVCASALKGYRPALNVLMFHFIVCISEEIRCRSSDALILIFSVISLAEVIRLGLFGKITWLECNSFCTVHSTLRDDQMEEDFVGGKLGSGNMHIAFCPKELKVRDRPEDLNAGTMTD